MNLQPRTWAEFLHEADSEFPPVSLWKPGERDEAFHIDKTPNKMYILVGVPVEDQDIFYYNPTPYTDDNGETFDTYVKWFICKQNPFTFGYRPIARFEDNWKQAFYQWRKILAKPSQLDLFNKAG